MQVQIMSEKTNALLHRREVKAVVRDFESTPTKEQVLQALAQKLRAPLDTLVLNGLRQEYGKREAHCEVKAYEDASFKQRYEPKPAKKEAKPGAGGEAAAPEKTKTEKAVEKPKTEEKPKAEKTEAKTEPKKEVKPAAKTEAKPEAKKRVSD